MCNGDRETAQLLGMLAALSENLSLALSTHVGQFTTTSPRESNVLFWPLWVPHSCMHTYNLK